MKIFLELKDVIYYDSTSPSGLRWNKTIFVGKNKNRIIVNKHDVAGCKNTEHQYWQFSYNRKIYKNHRVILDLFNLLEKNKSVDHLNGVKTDNRIENLRCVSVKENNKNKSKSKSNKSGITGVFWEENKGTLYASCDFHLKSGKRLRTRFMVKKFGLLESFALAVKERNRLLKQDETYTERHGK